MSRNILVKEACKGILGKGKSKGKGTEAFNSEMLGGGGGGVLATCLVQNLRYIGKSE